MSFEGEHYTWAAPYTKAAMSKNFFDCPLEMELGPICFCRTNCQNPPSQRDCSRMYNFAVSMDDADRDMVSHHIYLWLESLSTSAHAYSIVQVLLDGANPTLIHLFIREANIHKLICDPFGSRVIQRLTEARHGRYSKLLLTTIKERFVHFASHPRANYVIQSICATIPPKHVVDLITVVLPHAAKMSTHRHGAYCLQTVFNNVQTLTRGQYGEERLCDQLVSRLVDLGSQLVLNPHGNFTAQSMIGCFERCKIDTVKRFVQDLNNNFLECAKSKSGSRVIEKVLEVGDDWSKDMLVDTMLNLSHADFRRFARAHSSSFVVSKALEFSAESPRTVALYNRFKRERRFKKA